jgi:hypothetical protein
MDQIFDAEFPPGDESGFLLHRGSENNVAPRKPCEAWNQLDFTTENRRKIVNVRKQQEAVWELVKNGFARKLLAFTIMYGAISMAVMVAKVAVNWFERRDVLSADLLIFFVISALYYASLISLSIIYGLYRDFGWRIPLVVALLIIAALSAWKFSLKPIALITIAIIAVPAVILVIKRRHLWKHFKSWLALERKNNTNDSQDRDAFQKRMQAFLRAADKESRQRLPWPFDFKCIRNYVIKSSVGIVWLTLRRIDPVNQKEALEEYVRHHRFKDSMGRLATVLWIAGALGYLIFSDTPLTKKTELVAVNVLPIYVAMMFLMERFDEAREDVFRELARLIRTEDDTARHITT